MTGVLIALTYAVQALGYVALIAAAGWGLHIVTRES